MPLSFLTRRGSKKTPNKSAHSRDASTTTDQQPEQKAEQKQEVAPVDGPSTTKGQAQQTSIRRRVTNSVPTDAGADDVFLNLANGDERKTKTRNRSKSTGLETPPPIVEATDHSNPLKYLQSLSQRTSRAPERRGSQDPKATLTSADRQDQASSVSSRTPTVRNSKTATIGDTSAGSNNWYSAATQYKTPSPTRPAYRPSELAYTTPETYDTLNNAPKSAPLESKKQHWPHASDDLASQASTTAQSGLWDELHELKSRMRKLESSSTRSRHYSTTTGTDHTSSWDRPKTGTTQTTPSASRRGSNNDHLSPALHPRPHTAPQDSQEIHPLLHSALRKANQAVSPEVFNALESSASDALQLAATARTGVDPSDQQSLVSTSIADDPIQQQKRIQRKADNLCRSLTELCIVLCEQARATSSSSNFPPRSPLDYSKPPPSALSNVNLSVSRPTSSGRLAPASEYGTPSSTHLKDNGYTDSPTSHLDQRRALAERIAKLQSRANARSLDSRTPNGRANSVVEKNSNTWTPKPPNRAATTANSTRLNLVNMPQDPADLVDEDSTASSTNNNNNASSSDSDEDGDYDRRSTIRATRAQTEPPAPLANIALRTIGPGGEVRGHSPRDLRLSKDYTQRHPRPEGLSPTIRRALEGRNGSNPSVASSRTTRAGSVSNSGAGDRTPRTYGMNGHTKRPSVRTTEVGRDDDAALSPTSTSTSQFSRNTSISGEPETIRRGSKPEHERNDYDTKSERSRRSSNAGRKGRLPPSTGAGLAERLEAKRQQRMGSESNTETNGSINGRART